MSNRDSWTLPEKAALLALIAAAGYAALSLPAALRARRSAPEDRRPTIADRSAGEPSLRGDQPLPDSVPRWGDLALGGCILLYDAGAGGEARLAVLYATDTPNPGLPAALLEGRRGLKPRMVAADKRVLGELWQRWRRSGLLHLTPATESGSVTRELALTGGGRTLRLRRGSAAEPAFESAVRDLEAALEPGSSR